MLHLILMITALPARPPLPAAALQPPPFGRDDVSHRVDTRHSASFSFLLWAMSTPWFLFFHFQYQLSVRLAVSFQVFGFFCSAHPVPDGVHQPRFLAGQPGPRIWKSLHMMVYFAYASAGNARVAGRTATGGLSAGAALLVSGNGGGNWAAPRRSYKAANGWKIALAGTAADGFVPVCRVDEILENRAKVVIIRQENIAIFKYDGNCRL